MVDFTVLMQNVEYILDSLSLPPTIEITDFVKNNLLSFISDHWILSTTLTLFILLFFYLLYSGLFTQPKLYRHKFIICDSSSDQTAYLLFKTRRGSYHTIGPAFQSLSSKLSTISPNLQIPPKTFGLYFDNPANVPEDQCRAAIGFIFTDAHIVDRNATDFSKKFNIKIPEGFETAILPPSSDVIHIQFPIKNFFSLMFGISRCYHKLHQYIDRNNISCVNQGPEFGLMEIYTGFPGDMTVHFFVDNINLPDGTPSIINKPPLSAGPQYSDVNTEKKNN